MSINFRVPTVSVTACAVATSLTVATGAWAAGIHFAGPGLGIGMPGKAADVTMTMPVVMTDNEYDSATISVRKGQTVRFVIRNKGDFVHEFNIGTATMHVAHRREMMAMVESGMLELGRINRDKMKMNTGGHGHDRADGHAGKMMGMRGGEISGSHGIKVSAPPMVHDDPNSVLVAPGESAEVIWKFNRRGNLEFACNVPGHYESGMKGKFSIIR